MPVPSGSRPYLVKRPGSKAYSVYYASLAIVFVLVDTLFRASVETLMISEKRKIIGVIFLTISTSFFLILSFKSSHSKIFIIPLFLSVFFLIFPVLTLMQESVYGFNYVNTENDVLPFCHKYLNTSYPSVSDYKYITFEPVSPSPSNVIFGIVSTYLIGLVTGRRFIINENDRISTILRDYSSLFGINKSIFWTNVSYSNNSLQTQYLQTTYCRHCSIRYKHPDFLKLVDDNINLEFTKTFLVVKTNFYLVPAIIANNHYRSMVCSDFKSAKLFKVLFNRIFTIPETVSEKVNKFLQFHQEDLIGVQIILRGRIAFPEELYLNFFSCTDIILQKYKNASVYISTDSPGTVIPRAIDFFGRDRVIHLESIKESLLDMIILSKCKELFLTPYSAYGAIASALGDINPHYLTRKEGYCFKDIVSEPKCPYWHSLGTSSISQHSSSDTINFEDSFL